MVRRQLRPAGGRERAAGEQQQIVDQPGLGLGILRRPMLAALSIRDVVLIEKLALSLNAGLCVLTGETGAGKSILLDALGLALGSRGDSTLVRHGSDQASVTAEFDLPRNHAVLKLLAEQGIDVEG